MARRRATARRMPAAILFSCLSHCISAILPTASLYIAHAIGQKASDHPACAAAHSSPEFPRTCDGVFPSDMERPRAWRLFSARTAALGWPREEEGARNAVTARLNAAGSKRLPFPLVRARHPSCRHALPSASPSFSPHLLIPLPLSRSWHLAAVLAAACKMPRSRAAPPQPGRTPRIAHNGPPPYLLVQPPRHPYSYMRSSRRLALLMAAENVTTNTGRQ